MSVKIKKILVSQPQPGESEKSPYAELADRNHIKVDFVPFIRVEGVTAREFRQYRVDILQHTAIIFTSKTGIDHFFRICEEMRITVPDTMKYFCSSESVALYLQKYIVYRKRKIFFSKTNFSELVELMAKHKGETILLPLSEPHKPEIPSALDAHKFSYTKVILYRTVCCDLSSLVGMDYDMLVFYSPAEIKSLFQNFPDFVQNDTRIASFGAATAKAIREAGLRLDVEAPQPAAPSMTMALDQYFKEQLKENKVKHA
jgi:uroporphyrinogen-III synthase